MDMINQDLKKTKKHVFLVLHYFRFGFLHVFSGFALYDAKKNAIPI